MPHRMPLGQRAEDICLRPGLPTPEPEQVFRFQVESPRLEPIECPTCGPVRAGPEEAPEVLFPEQRPIFLLPWQAGPQGAFVERQQREAVLPAFLRRFFGGA